MQVMPVSLLGCADKLIPQLQLQARRTPTQTSHRSRPGQHQILEMFAHRPAVAQVVIAAEQMGEEFLALAAAHQPNLQRSQRPQR